MCLFGIYSIFHQSLTTSEFLLQNMNISSKLHHKSLPTYFFIFPYGAKQNQKNMKMNLISRVFCCMIVAAVAGCAGIDTIDDISVAGLRIVYKVGGVSDTKAYLINTANIEEMCSEMTVKAVKRNTSASADDVMFTDTFAPSTSATTSLHQLWQEDSYVFYSYPTDMITPSFAGDAMQFDMTVGTNSTDTDDIIVARTVQTRGNVVSFEYKHIFTAVNVLYKTTKIGHKITRIAVKNTKLTGSCKIGDNGQIIWENVQTPGDMVDEYTRYATINNTELTQDGCKFMTIPNQPITIEVVIDGKTLTKTCEAKQPGDIVNFYIEDDFEIKKEDGSEAAGEVVQNPDGTYKMTLETYVTGEYKTVITAKPMDFILVLDYSGTMTNSYSDPAMSSFSCANVTTHTYNDWKSNPSKYKATLNGSQYTITCNNIKNSGTDNIHWAYITVGSDRYYITLDGGLYKSSNVNPSMSNIPVSEEGVKIFPVTGGSNALWGDVTYKSKSINNRILALQAAVYSFIDSVKTYSDRYGVKHRVSIIEFQKPSFPTFTGQSSGRANYIESGNRDYLRQSYALSTDNNNKMTTGVLYPFREIDEANTVESMKGALSLVGVIDGSTAIDYGMYLAWLRMSDCRSDAGKTIVVFTDGRPTHSGASILAPNVIPGYNSTGSVFSDDQVANGAVQYAKLCKDADATIFSIGVFSSSQRPQNGFMDAISSNYPHAQSITSLGEGSDQGYYKDASNSSLNEAFQTIAVTTTTAAIDIHSDAYVKSIISDAFVLPANYIEGSGKVHFYECAQTGYDSAAQKIIWSDTKTDITSQINCQMEPENQSISISGFDYGKNFCLCDTVGPYTGKKLIMVFDGLVANDEHIGTGQNLAIEYSTGLYNPDGTPVSMFQPIYINL